METVNIELLKQLYAVMFKIRKFEEELYSLFLTGQMFGTIHQCDGQEAIASGVCANLKKEDYIISTHRGHGHCIAKGISLNKLAAELFGKSTGCCKGMGGSMHIADISVGIMGTTAIVGAGLPITVGLGLSIKTRKTSQVAVCFFGEGASNEGAFHESLNMASIWKLPVIFICENNLYGFSTPVSKVMNIKDVAQRAKSYGMDEIVVDGNDVVAVYDTVKKYIDFVRSGKGPVLIECKTYRHKGHSRFEPANYRTIEEVEEWKKKDPVKCFKNILKENYHQKEEDIKVLEENINAEIKSAIEYAKNSPGPVAEESLKYAYAN